MIIIYALCICIILLLIICIRCLLVGIKDLCLELAGIYNLLNDIRYMLSEQDEKNNDL